MWRGLAVVFALVSLAACSFQISPPVSGDLQVGGYQIAQLPPAQEKGGELRPGVQVYRIALNATQAVRVSAVSADLQLRARMRLVLLDEQGVVQAVSVARNWFGAYPEVTPLALHPQIATDPGLRLNFRGQVGQVFYLRIENYALSADRVTLYADAFTPNPAGQGRLSLQVPGQGPSSSPASLTATTWRGPQGTCVLPTLARWISWLFFT